MLKAVGNGPVERERLAVPAIKGTAGRRGCRGGQSGEEAGFLRAHGQPLRRNRREGKKADGVAPEYLEGWRGSPTDGLTAASTLGSTTP